MGGFSQGAAMSCILMMSGEVGGCVGGWWVGSGWMPFRRQIEESITSLPEGSSGRDSLDAVRGYVRDLLHLPSLEEGNKVRSKEAEGYRAGETGDRRKERVYIQHGKQDQKMLLEWGEQMGDVLRMIGCEVEMDVYIMGHWWSEESLAGLARWIEDVLGGHDRDEKEDV